MYNNEQLALMAAGFLKALCERAVVLNTPGFKTWTEAQHVIAIQHARKAAHDINPSNK